MKKILLVDDEPDILETLRFRLSAGGYDVDVAPNGAEALAMVRNGGFDLVVADFMMPELNGIELTRQIKADPVLFLTKVILFSANPDPNHRKRAMECGAEEYLPKTQGAAFLAEKINEALGSSEASNAQPAAEKAASPPAAEDTQFRRELSLLTRSLTDLLRLAQSTGELPEATRYAVESASRVADDIRKLAEKSPTA